MGEHAVKVFTAFLLAAVVIFVAGMAQQGHRLEMVTVHHTVRQGETLWTIGERYIMPDRQMLEFIEGIYELNYDKVFAGREKNGSPKKSVYPGDELEIHYWR